MVRAANRNKNATINGIYISTVVLEENSHQGPTWVGMDSSSEENPPSKS